MRRIEIDRHFLTQWRLHFLALQVQLVVLVNAFVMVSTDLSVFCLLFSYTGRPKKEATTK